jgi:glycosyltransferase involved in cell wall biosynthesis
MTDKNILVGFEGHILSGRWTPAKNKDRSFVKYIDSTDSPGAVWKQEPADSHIILSIIIPTLDAHRDGYFQKLLTQIDHQDFTEYQILVVKGDPRQGRAINIAAALSKGKYLLTLDDDTSLPDKTTFSKLVTIMEEHPNIGIAGGNNIIPANINKLARLVMQQVPRRSWIPVKKITVSDLAEHPCMIMRTDEFKKVGGENELIPRGLDPYLREEFRKIDKLVVVVPEVIYHHLPPDSLSKLFRQFFRNGFQAFQTNRLYPQWVIETPNNHGPFKTHKNKLIRRFRFFKIMLESIVTMKPVWFFCELAYASGYVWSMLREKPLEVLINLFNTSKVKRLKD